MKSFVPARKFAVCLVLSLALSLPFAVHAESKGQSLSDDEITRRGEQLRSDIQDKYQALADSRQLQAAVDIGGLITSYIPLQTTIVDAESILGKAGARIDYDCRQGACAKIIVENGWFSKTEAFVILYPDVSGDQHARVGKLTAALQHTTLWHREPKPDMQNEEPAPESEKGLLEGREPQP